MDDWVSCGRRPIPHVPLPRLWGRGAESPRRRQRDPVTTPPPPPCRPLQLAGAGCRGGAWYPRPTTGRRREAPRPPAGDIVSPTKRKRTSPPLATARTTSRSVNIPSSAWSEMTTQAPTRRSDISLAASWTVVSGEQQRRSVCMISLTVIVPPVTKTGVIVRSRSTIHHSNPEGSGEFPLPGSRPVAHHKSFQHTVSAHTPDALRRVSMRSGRRLWCQRPGSRERWFTTAAAVPLGAACGSQR